MSVTMRFYEKPIVAGQESRMRVKGLLNRVYRHKGFVYADVRLSTWARRECVEVKVGARAGSRGICSSCGREAPGYDTLGERRFEFVPLWGLAVYFLYVMRRVECPRCGVKVERVPWCEGKHFVTTAYAWFLAGWAKRLSWSEVAEAFHTSWHYVATSVEMAVEWGLARRSLDGITAIGVDELHWGRRGGFVTVVYQINEGMRRLLWIGQRRRVRTLLGFFRWLGPERSARLRFVCSDMWAAYVKVIRKKASQALHILDRFHIVARLNRAVDQTRRREAGELKRQGREPVLARSRWCLLKRPENLTENQRPRLRELLRMNLRTVRAYLLKEDFKFFWEYTSAYWAGRFLDGWCSRAMRSRLKEFKTFARTVRGHRELILNWFRARKAFSCGVVEGLNNKAKVVTKQAYGFHTYRILEIALYHRLGQLPEPECAHRFS
jgi:transposase